MLGLVLKTADTRFVFCFYVLPLDAEPFDTYKCSCDQQFHERMLDLQKRDAMNQVKDGRCFWLVLAISSPHTRAATCGQSGRMKRAKWQSEGQGRRRQEERTEGKRSSKECDRPDSSKQRSES